MFASPWAPIRICRKSPRVRSPHWPPITVWIEPRWTKCSLASVGGVKVGDALFAFADWARKRLQSPRTESGPVQPLFAVPAGAGVPYQAMSTRPAAPAATQAKTLFNSPGVGICTGVVQVVPSSAEEAMNNEVLPVIAPCEPGASSHTAYSVPAWSIASVGKLPPVTWPGKLATGRSKQDNPLGSVVKGTVWQRPSRI